MYGMFLCVGDLLDYFRGQRFFIYDRDLDLLSGNCVVGGKVGWWYKFCYSVFLMGVYYKKLNVFKWQGVMWFLWKGIYYLFKFVIMMLRKY